MGMIKSDFAPIGVTEKYVGSAYDTVKKVSDNIDAVTVVSTNINDVVNAAGIAAGIGADKVAVEADRAEVAANTATVANNLAQTTQDRAQTTADAVLTAADRVQTGLDAVATAADRVQTGTDATTATQQAAIATAQATAAAASFDSFDDRYLGAFAVAPALDNDGAPLTAGAAYWDTVKQAIQYYNGAAWEDPEASAIAAANSANADATQTAADRAAVATDLLLTDADQQATAIDAAAAAADRIQTGLDKTATNADAAQTALDAVATAADRVQTTADKVATTADRTAVAYDRVQTGLDKAGTAANLLATNQDTIDTAADAAATATDRILAEQAATSAQLAESNAVAVVTGGTASLPAAAGMIPIADAKGHIDDSWLSYTIPALTAQYPGLNVVASYFYDTSKDSDGGAWVHHTADLGYGKEAVPSGRYVGSFSDATAATAAGGLIGDWFYRADNGSFNELTGVNVSAQISRAGSAAFPAQVLNVAEDNRVIVFDASGPELTMFKVITGHAEVKAIYAAEGIVFVGQGSDNSTNKGLWAHKFSRGLSYHYTNFTGSSNQGYNNSIKTSLPVEAKDVSLGVLVHNNVNDVAAVVLGNAPTDLITGLKVPTIAVATDGGVSVIKDDGSVVDLTTSFTGYEASKWVSWRNDGAIIFPFETPANAYGRRFWVLHNIPVIDLVVTTTVNSKGVADEWYGEYSPTVAKDLIMLASGSVGLTASSQGSYASALGLTRIHENPSDPTKGMVAHITDKKNTGWMVGDCQMAALCETEAGAVVETELVTNGTFDTDLAGWIESSGAGGSVTWSAGAAHFVSDGDGASISQNVGTGLMRLNVEITEVTSGQLRWGQADSSAAAGYIALPSIPVTVGIHTMVVELTKPWLFIGRVVACDIKADNISAKQVIADHSGNGNHLDIIGTLNRAPIGNGEIAAWSGFSDVNYLGATVSSIGTGPFTLKFIGVLDANAYRGFIDLNPSRDNFAPLIRISHSPSGGMRPVVDSTPIGDLTSVPVGTPFHVMLTRDEAGSCTFYFNGGKVGASATVISDLSTTDPMLIGGYWQSQAVVAGGGQKISLLRVSKTCASADQVAKMYRDELAMIQGNAVLPGSDPDIKALAYDKERDLLHAANASTVSSFRGLERIDSTTPSVGTISSLDAQDGALIIAGTNGVDVDIPAVSIRERLAQALPKPTSPAEDFFFTGDGAITDFSLPKGWKPKRVWVDGGKKRFGAAEDYTIKSDGFIHRISFAVAPALNAEIDVEGYNV